MKNIGKYRHIGYRNRQIIGIGKCEKMHIGATLLSTRAIVLAELVVALFKSFLFLYFFLGFCRTRRVVEESFHHKSTDESEEKLLRGGPSVFISNKSSKVSELRLVLFSVLITFKIEKVLSTFAVEKGKLNKRLQMCSRFCQLPESGEACSLYQTF